MEQRLQQVFHGDDALTQAILSPEGRNEAASSQSEAKAEAEAAARGENQSGNVPSHLQDANAEPRIHSSLKHRLEQWEQRMKEQRKLGKKMLKSNKRQRIK